jgi:hypothetical protein
MRGLMFAHSLQFSRSFGSGANPLRMGRILLLVDWVRSRCAVRYFPPFAGGELVILWSLSSLRKMEDELTRLELSAKALEATLLGFLNQLTRDMKGWEWKSGKEFASCVQGRFMAFLIPAPLLRSSLASVRRRESSAKASSSLCL